MGTLSNATAITGQGAMQGQVVAAGGNLYMVALYDPLSTGSSNALGMWKSTDDGATWTEQDTSNRPTTLTGPSNIDALAWVLSNGSAHDPTTVAGDVTTESLSAANQAPHGVAFHTSGTKMYVADSTDAVIYEYPLSTAWDLSTKGTEASGSLNASNTAARDIAFNSNGTKVFCLDLTLDLYEYNLSTAWDITTIDSGSFVDLGADMAGGSSSTGFSFNNDGTKLYAFDGTQHTIYQWTLSTAYDISTKGTASFGTKSLDNTAEQDMLFSTDGTTLWVLDANDGIYEYPLSTAWDITTIGTGTLVGGHFGDFNQSPRNWTTKTDGTAIYWTDNSTTSVVYEASLKPVISVIYGGDTATGKNAAAEFRYATFDTTTDTWVVNEQIDAPDWGSTEVITHYGCGIAVRPDGDVVVVYRGADRTSMGSGYTQVGYNVRTGGTWSGWTGMTAEDVNQRAPRCVLGASDDTHIVYWATGANYGDTLSSSTDTLGTRASMAYVSIAFSLTHRSMEYVPATTPRIAILNGSAPGWEHADITESSFPGSVATESTPLSGGYPAFVWDGLTGDDRLYAVGSHTDSDMYTSYVADGDNTTNNWTTAVEAVDAVTGDGVWATVYTDGSGNIDLGFIYENSGTLTWGEVQLQAGTTEQFLTPSLLSLAPSFPTATVIQEQFLTPSLLSLAPSFPTATVGSNYDLTAALLDLNFTVPTHQIDEGNVDITAAVYDLGLAFPTATVSSNYDVDATLLDLGLTFPTATVAATYDLTASLLSLAPSFPTATVDLVGPEAEPTWVSTPSDGTTIVPGDGQTYQWAFGNEGQENWGIARAIARADQSYMEHYTSDSSAWSGEANCTIGYDATRDAVTITVTSSGVDTYAIANNPSTIESNGLPGGGAQLVFARVGQNTGNSSSTFVQLGVRVYSANDTIQAWSTENSMTLNTSDGEHGFLLGGRNSLGVSASHYWTLGLYISAANATAGDVFYIYDAFWATGTTGTDWTRAYYRDSGNDFFYTNEGITWENNYSGTSDTSVTRAPNADNYPTGNVYPENMAMWVWNQTVTREADRFGPATPMHYVTVDPTQTLTASLLDLSVSPVAGQEIDNVGSPQGLTASLLSLALAFPTATVTSNYDLTASLLDISVTVPTHQIDEGNYDITASLLDLGFATITAAIDEGNYDITAALLDLGFSVPQATVIIEQFLTAALLDLNMQFGLDSVTSTYQVTPTLFDLNMTFPAATVIQEQFLTPSLLSLPVTTVTATVSSNYDLDASLLDLSLNFPTATVIWEQFLTPALLDLGLTIPTHVISAGQVLSASLLDISVSPVASTVTYTYDITAALLDLGFNVPTATVTYTYDLAATLLDLSPSFPTATVNATYGLEPTLLDMSLTIGTSTITHIIAPTLYDLGMTFPQATVESGAQPITATLLDLSFTFPSTPQVLPEQFITPDTYEFIWAFGNGLVVRGDGVIAQKNEILGILQEMCAARGYDQQQDFLGSLNSLCQVSGQDIGNALEAAGASSREFVGGINSLAATVNLEALGAVRAWALSGNF